jgi:hypothetical protein
VQGLPQHGFPYAVATTRVRLDPEGKQWVRVLKVDPRMVSAEPVEAPDHPPSGGVSVGSVVAVVGAGPVPMDEEGTLHLWHGEREFFISRAPPLGGVTRLGSGLAAPTDAAAVLGIEGETGMLIYVEVERAGAEGSLGAPKAPGARLGELLTRLGGIQPLFLERPLAIALGGDSDLAGNATHPPSGAGVVTLVRIEGPGGRRVFEATPVVPLATWYPLQQHRVRYFKETEKTDAGDAGDE